MTRRRPGGPVEAAIIDLDGTLLDTLGDFVVVLERTLFELGLPDVSRGFIERTMGKGADHLVRCVLAEVGADAGLFDRAWPLYRQHYLAVNGSHSDIYPGVVEGLDRMRQAGWRLACVTNKPIAFARPLLQVKGLLGSFDRVYGGDSFERRKPDPLPLLRTCEALGSVPARTLMVGDSVNDALAARAAGCPVVMVRYGYNHGESIDSVDADAWIDRIDELPGPWAQEAG